jgi:hypothetical protein
MKTSSPNLTTTTTTPTIDDAEPNAPIAPESNAPQPNVHYLKLIPVEPSEPEEPRAPYSFDITQTDERGLVLIDACVPLAMAIEFMNLVMMYNPD